MFRNKRISIARAILKVSQAQFVGTSFSVSTLSRIEHGNLVPSMNFLSIISDLWNIPFSYFAVETFMKKNEIYALMQANKQLGTTELLALNFYLTLSEPMYTVLEVSSFLIEYYYKNNRMEDAERVFLLSKQMLQTISITDKIKMPVVQQYQVYGDYMYRSGNYNEAENHYLLANDLLKDTTTIEQANTYYKLARVFHMRNQDFSEYIYKALNIYEQFHSDLGKMRCLNMLCILFGKTRQSELFFQTINEAIVLAEKLNDEDSLHLLKDSMGQFYQKTGNIALAIQHLEETVTNRKSSYRQIYALASLIDIYLHYEINLEKAHTYLQTAMKIVDDYQFHYQRVQIYHLNALYYLNIGNISAYELEMDKLLEFTKSKNYKELVIQLSEELAEHYANEKQYKKSHKIYHNLLVFCGILERKET